MKPQRRKRKSKSGPPGVRVRVRVRFRCRSRSFVGRSIPLVLLEVIFRRPRRSVTSLELVPSPSRRAHQESSWVDGKKK